MISEYSHQNKNHNTAIESDQQYYRRNAIGTLATVVAICGLSTVIGGLTHHDAPLPKEPTPAKEKVLSYKELGANHTIEYTVRYGDTLSELADDLQHDNVNLQDNSNSQIVDSIIKANNLDGFVVDTKIELPDDDGINDPQSYVNNHALPPDIRLQNNDR